MIGTENRRLDHCVVNVERELQECQATLRHREASVESVRKQVREVEDENRRYVIDLQAFERQVDALCLSGGGPAEPHGEAQR